jgi:hypothetical protein
MKQGFIRGFLSQVIFQYRRRKKFFSTIYEREYPLRRGFKVEERYIEPKKDRKIRALKRKKVKKIKTVKKMKTVKKIKRYYTCVGVKTMVGVDGKRITKLVRCKRVRIKDIPKNIFILKKKLIVKKKRIKRFNVLNLIKQIEPKKVRQHSLGAKVWRLEKNTLLELAYDLRENERKAKLLKRELKLSKIGRVPKRFKIKGFTIKIKGPLGKRRRKKPYGDRNKNWNRNERQRFTGYQGGFAPGKFQGFASGKFGNELRKRNYATSSNERIQQLMVVETEVALTSYLIPGHISVLKVEQAASKDNELMYCILFQQISKKHPLIKGSTMVYDDSTDGGQIKVYYNDDVVKLDLVEIPITAATKPLTIVNEKNVLDWCRVYEIKVDGYQRGTKIITASWAVLIKFSLPYGLRLKLVKPVYHNDYQISYPEFILHYYTMAGRLRHKVRPKPSAVDAGQ